MKRPLLLMIVVILIVIAAETGSAHPSWGIVVSSTGEVYFSDLETVWKIDRAATSTSCR